MQRLIEAGIEYADAVALRRIAMTLHRWHELECGTEYGYIERDDTTGIPFHYHPNHLPGGPRSIPDREKGALKRLVEIMKRYPSLVAYVQTDPRGLPLYIIRPGDVPAGRTADGFYTYGIGIGKQTNFKPRG